MILNIRFDSLEARHLGIEGHVCEVQLTSKGFVNLLVRYANLITEIPRFRMVSDASTFPQDEHMHSRYLYLRAIRQFARQSKCRPKSAGSIRVAPGPEESAVVVEHVVGQDSHRAIEVVVPVNQQLPTPELLPWAHNRPQEFQGVSADNLHAQLPRQDININRRMSVSVAWDCPLNDWLDSIALRVFQRCSVHAGNILDQKASAIDKAFHQSSTSSVVFTRFA